MRALRANETKITSRNTFIVKLFALESVKESKNEERTPFETARGFLTCPLKKENLRRKSFSDNVEWSSKKLWKMIFTDIKTDVKQEVKELVAVSYNFSQNYILKTEIQYKASYGESKLFFI